MRSSIPILFLAASLWCAPILEAAATAEKTQPTQASADVARSLVQQQARAVQSIDRFEVSHQIDVTMITPRFKQTTHSYVKTWVKRPGHIRAESQHLRQSETIVSDGAATWFYNGTDRTYWKQPEPAPAALFSNTFPGLARQLGDSNLPQVMTSAKLTGAETLQIGGRNFPCDVVEINVQPGASNDTLENNSLRLWISQKYHVPLKVEATFVGGDASDRKLYSDRVTEFQPNLNIPKSIWVFQPPPDSTPRPGTTAPSAK